ncbi:MAG TPA: ABC transporter ATP-binding protein [Acidobacteriota bacterium]|nr:ABC transporter ATP-binding protein [Acidobacteriota bacterium]
MLELRGVSKKFSAFTVVKDVSFAVRPGEVLGYLGPNGAGKTTTIKMLAGLLEPSKGEILLDGRGIGLDLPAYKRRLGYVPEQSEIYPHLSAFDYLRMVGRLRGMDEASLPGRVMAFLRIFDLEQDMHGPIASFSKGMRQKVLIVAALLHDPDILLLDEPLSGLDVTTGLVVRDLIRRLAAENKIIIYSSHVLEVTEKICTKVIILHKGGVVANDSVENLRQLMHLPSLSEIFSELVLKEDTDAVAARLVGAMKGDA